MSGNKAWKITVQLLEWLNGLCSPVLLKALSASEHEQSQARHARGSVVAVLLSCQCGSELLWMNCCGDQGGAVLCCSGRAGRTWSSSGERLLHRRWALTEVGCDDTDTHTDTDTDTDTDTNTVTQGGTGSLLHVAGAS